MKKLILFITIILLLTALIGCNRQDTIEEALEKANIKVEHIYHVKNYDNMTFAFYKEKSTGNPTIGVFVKDNSNYKFVNQDYLNSNPNHQEELSFHALINNHVKGLPEYSFQYGIISNSEIDKVNLHMAGEPYIADRFADIVQIDGLRVWYTYSDKSSIFNIQQGLSKEGKVIYSNSKAYQ